MKKLLSRASPYIMLATVGAVAVPTVVWLLCKASEIEAISKVLRQMK